MRQINKAAVLGAGVMGATIAAHLANAGIPVVLLDMAPKELNAAEKAAGLTIDNPKVRNRIAAAGLEGLKKMKPAPLFLPAYAGYIETGNFEDNMGELRQCDWVVEVVTENMAIKKQLFSEKVAPNLKEGAILSTNTSGLSINEMAECLPENIRKNMLVTHFFNPPRYMQLLEIVSLRLYRSGGYGLYGQLYRKTARQGRCLRQGHPNFIANRIGVYSICSCIHTMLAMEMTIEEVDAVAGPATARPKSATFRTSDLVGIDTLLHVANNSYDLLTNDEEREIFRLPGLCQRHGGEGVSGQQEQTGLFQKGQRGERSGYLLLRLRNRRVCPVAAPAIRVNGRGKIH